MTDEKKRDARARLMAFVPHLQLAAKEAEVAARGRSARQILAVGYENQDRTGAVTARFDRGPFVEDLVTILGFDTMGDLLRAQEAEEGAAGEKAEVVE